MQRLCHQQSVSDLLNTPTKDQLERDLLQTMGPGHYRRFADEDLVETNEEGVVTAESLDRQFAHYALGSRSITHSRGRIAKKFRELLYQSAIVIDGYCDTRAKGICAVVKAAFPNEDATVTPQEIEAVLRPLSPDSYLLRRYVARQTLPDHIHRQVRDWAEANQICLGEGPGADYGRNFFFMQPCSCVYPYLPTAMEKAGGNVDQRIVQIYERWKDTLFKGR